MRIGIVAQKGNDRATELTAELSDALADGVDVALDAATATALGRDGTPVEEMAGLPFVVSVGGDGTFLYTARHVGSTPIMGVNLGEVGFLNAVSPDEAPDRVRDEVNHARETGMPRFREVPRIAAHGDGWSLPPGMNEVVVQGERRGPGGGLEIEVRVDGSLYTGGHADGVLVATQTGSTAYNLSEGGPLVHPSVDGFVVTEMCAIESMPPLLVGLDREITIRATGTDRAVVGIDGRSQREIETPATISVTTADEPARIAGPRSDFFRALNKIS